MVPRAAGLASGAAPGVGGRDAGRRWLVPSAAAAPVPPLSARVRRSQLLVRGMTAPATPVRMHTQPATWRFRNATWAVIAKAIMAPAATSVSDVAVFMLLAPFFKSGAAPGPGCAARGNL